MSTAIKTKVSVKVPATTANLGPAYDVLGMALDVWLELTVERADAFSFAAVGQGAELIETDESNLIVQCTKTAFEQCGEALPTLKFTLKSDIPFGCGCGSSSAATVAGVMAGFMLCGKALPAAGAEELLQVVSNIEGHPDNAAPAIYGGLQLGMSAEKRFVTHRIGTPHGLWCVLFVPHQKMKKHTSETRKLIPTEVPMADAIHNMSRASVVVLAMATGNLAMLKDCMEDRFHQTQRAPMFPHMQPAVDAAMANGASYSFLSGAGPTICAFVQGRTGDIHMLENKERHCGKVAKAMIAAAAGVGIAGSCVITQPSDVGAHFTAISPSTADDDTHVKLGM